MGTLSKELERQLLYRLSTSDESALAELMRLYYNDLYHYAFSVGADEMSIKDAIQEIFISLWHRRSEAEKILSLKFYLLRAIKNLALKSIAASNKQNHFKYDYSHFEFKIESSSEYKIIEKEIELEKRKSIKTILEKLPPRNQEVLYLKFFLCLTNEQIADIMSINIQSVYNLMYESLQRFKTFWNAELGVTIKS